jgi:hypothetical protein
VSPVFHQGDVSGALVDSVRSLKSPAASLGLRVKRISHSFAKNPRNSVLVHVVLQL